MQQVGFGIPVQLLWYGEWWENVQKRQERGNLRKEGDTRRMGKEPLKKKKAQVTVTLKETARQDVRNSEGAGSIADSHVYDCVCKSLLRE